VTRETTVHKFERLGRVLFVVGAALVGLMLLMLVPGTVRSSETQQALPEGWQDILNETFDGGIGAGWTVTDTSTTDGGEYMWGTATFTYTSPITAAWMVGGGADGSGLVAGTDEYTDNVDSWLIYGPLDLSRVFQADLTFDWWLDSASGDWFTWCVMTDITDLTEGCSGAPKISGSIRTWISGTLSLDDYANTATSIYLVFHFTSNGDGQRGDGVFVDNVVVRGYYGHLSFLPAVWREPTPTPSGYEDNFSGPTTWEMVQKTEGRPGTWWDIRNSSGYLKIMVDERWDHIIASPRVVSTDPPFEIEASIYFHQRSWSSGYAIVFGSADEHFQSSYYRILAVYTQDGVMKYQVKRMRGTDTTERTILDWMDIPIWVLDGREWNTWRIVRDGSHIRIYVNGHLLNDLTDSAITGKGYFGILTSTWEFKPIEVWVDYYNVLPR
jgi:hypothetical protein